MPRSTLAIAVTLFVAGLVGGQVQEPRRPRVERPPGGIPVETMVDVVVASSFKSSTPAHQAAYLARLRTDAPLEPNARGVYTPGRDDAPPRDGAFPYRLLVEHVGTVTTEDKITATREFVVTRDLGNVQQGYYIVHWWLQPLPRGAVTYTFQKWTGERYEKKAGWTMKIDPVGVRPYEVPLAKATADGKMPPVAAVRDDAIATVLPPPPTAFIKDVEKLVTARFVDPQKALTAAMKTPEKQKVVVEIELHNGAPWPARVKTLRPGDGELSLIMHTKAGMLNGEVSLDPPILMPGEKRKVKTELLRRSEARVGALGGQIPISTHVYGFTLGLSGPYPKD